MVKTGEAVYKIKATECQEVYCHSHTNIFIVRVNWSTLRIYKYGKNQNMRFESDLSSHDYFQEGRLRYREIKNRIMVNSFSDSELRNKIRI